MTQFSKLGSNFHLFFVLTLRTPNEDIHFNCMYKHQKQFNIYWTFVLVGMFLCSDLCTINQHVWLIKMISTYKARFKYPLNSRCILACEILKNQSTVIILLVTNDQYLTYNSLRNKYQILATFIRNWLCDIFIKTRGKEATVNVHDIKFCDVNQKCPVKPV